MAIQKLKGTGITTFKNVPSSFKNLGDTSLCSWRKRWFLNHSSQMSILRDPQLHCTLKTHGKSETEIGINHIMRQFGDVFHW